MVARVANQRTSFSESRVDVEDPQGQQPDTEDASHQDHPVGPHCEGAPRRHHRPPEPAHHQRESGDQTRELDPNTAPANARPAELQVDPPQARHGNGTRRVVLVAGSQVAVVSPGRQAKPLQEARQRPDLTFSSRQGLFVRVGGVFREAVPLRETTMALAQVSGCVNQSYDREHACDEAEDLGRPDADALEDRERLAAGVRGRDPDDRHQGDRHRSRKPPGAQLGNLAWVGGPAVRRGPAHEARRRDDQHGAHQSGGQPHRTQRKGHLGRGIRVKVCCTPFGLAQVPGSAPGDLEQSGRRGADSHPLRHLWVGNVAPGPRDGQEAADEGRCLVATAEWWHPPAEGGLEIRMQLEPVGRADHQVAGPGVLARVDQAGVEVRGEEDRVREARVERLQNELLVVQVAAHDPDRGQPSSRSPELSLVPLQPIREALNRVELAAPLGPLHSGDPFALTEVRVAGIHDSLIGCRFGFYPEAVRRSRVGNGSSPPVRAPPGRSRRPWRGR